MDKEVKLQDDKIQKEEKEVKSQNEKTQKEEKKVNYKKISEVENRQIEWLWYPYIPKGMITFVQGDPKCGKTTLLLDIISRISKGDKKPFSDENFKKGKILLQNGDDPYFMIKDKLEKMGADTNNIMFIDERYESLYFEETDKLKQVIAKEKPSLIVFDPIQAFAGDVNLNSQVESRKCLSPIKEIAELYNCAIVIVQHFKKSKEGKSNYWGAGSIDLPGIARSICMVIKDIEDKEVRYFIHSQTNLSKEGNSLSYKITDEGLEWLEDVGEVNPEELLGEEQSTKTELAKNFILGCLATNNEVLGTDWESIMKIGKFKSKTFNVARSILVKKDLIEPIKRNNKTFWKLKDDYKVQSYQVAGDITNE